VLDAITLSNSWRISERWDAGVRADWTQRKSATNGSRVFVVPGGPVTVIGTPNIPNVATAVSLVQLDSADSLDTQRWGMAARLAYRLTKNTVTSLQYTYNKQSSTSDTVGQSSDFDNHLVTFTVQYNFEPIGLWW
jgi:opacity protein-like surface antigen